jgi:hypothetical protein
MPRAAAIPGGKTPPLLSLLLPGLAVAAGCAPLTVPGGPADGGRVVGLHGALQIELRETSGQVRRAEPVRIGLPFPRRALASAANVRVVLSDGRELDSQRRVLGLWPDGSVRWLELIFEPAVAAGAVGRYRVEFGPKVKAAKPAKALRAVAEKGTVEVDTGRMRLSVGGGGQLEAWVDRDRDGRYAPEEQVLGGVGLESFVELRALKPGAAAGRFLGRGGARLVESGPLRAVVAWSGWHVGAGERKVCPYELRLEVYRNRSLVRLTRTMTLSEPPAESGVTEAGLQLALAPGGAPPPERRLVREVRAPKRYPDLAGFQSLSRLLEGGKVLEEGRRPGCLEVRTARFCLVAAVPRLAEPAPWELRAEPRTRRVVAAFWPRWGGEYTDARSPDQRGEPGFLEFTRTESYERFWEEPGPRHAVGAARTHELWLEFLPPDAPRSAAQDFGVRVGAPLVAWPGAGWIELSGVYGRFAGTGPGEAAPPGEWSGGAARLGAWLRAHQRKNFGWLGLWDYGDYQTVYRSRGDLDVGPRWWNWHGRWGWLQGREAFVPAMLVPWLASGRAADWEVFRAAAAHNLDVDTVHLAGRDADMVGATHGPGATHWSGPASPAWTYPSAWLDYYYLAGEPRGLEALRSLIDSLGGRTLADFGRPGESWSSDQAGCLRARLVAHEAFGEPHAAAAAAALAHFTALPGRELGGSEAWARELAPALIRYHRFTGNAAVARLIERGTRAYTASRGPAGGESSLSRNCYDCCAYAWRLSGDRYFLERGRQLAALAASALADAFPGEGAEPPVDLTGDSRAVIELGTLPYLEAALREVEEGR